MQRRPASRTASTRCCRRAVALATTDAPSPSRRPTRRRPRDDRSPSPSRQPTRRRPRDDRRAVALATTDAPSPSRQPLTVALATTAPRQGDRCRATGIGAGPATTVVARGGMIVALPTYMPAPRQTSRSGSTRVAPPAGRGQRRCADRGQWRCADAGNGDARSAVDGTAEAMPGATVTPEAMAGRHRPARDRPPARPGPTTGPPGTDHRPQRFPGWEGRGPLGGPAIPVALHYKRGPARVRRPVCPRGPGWPRLVNHRHVRRAGDGTRLAHAVRMRPAAPFSCRMRV
jgi:hypothetical protein